jgi:hypothetical protein
VLLPRGEHQRGVPVVGRDQVPQGVSQRKKAVAIEAEVALCRTTACGPCWWPLGRASRAVFLEDAISVSGDVITLAALALNQITGSSAPQGVAAVLIGLLLIRATLRLGKRSRDFLVGVWPLTSTAHGDRDDDGSATQPLTSADEQRIRAFLLGYPGVTAIHQVLVRFIGPGQVWVIARLDIDDDLRGAQVKSLVRGIESGMKGESEAVYRVDIVPGRAQAVRLRRGPTVLT